MADFKSIKQKIYDAIAENSSISRIRLAEKYSIRLATVTEVTRSLLKDNLIIEAGEEQSTGGRKPILLKVNSNAFYTLGLSLSRSHLVCGLFSSSMQQTYEIVQNTDSSLTPDELLKLLKDTIDKALSESGIKPAQVKGIGLGFPDKVDIDNGIYNGASYYPHLHGVKVKEFLEQEYSVPVIVDHDVVLMTMAEYYLSGTGIPDYLGVLFIGRGIGCRFILDGEIYRGVTNRASEFGHLSLQTDGPECYCGNRGCFEKLANTEAIESSYGNNKSFEEIVDLAFANDKKAIAILDQTAEYIAKAAANIINLMDVEMLILNGDIVIAKDIISDKVQEYFKKNHKNGDQQRVFFSGIGKKVGSLGPALMAADQYFLKKDINIFPKRKLVWTNA